MALPSAYSESKVSVVSVNTGRLGSMLVRYDSQCALTAVAASKRDVISCMSGTEKILGRESGFEKSCQVGQSVTTLKCNETARDSS